jgi:hypothetical protein
MRGSVSTTQAMKRIILSLLLFCLPHAALADGMVVPTIAFPAQVTIPDQRALICFSNGTERLVIETRFNGAGTNFAWVVPFPSQPVIEEATTGLFPTLQYLFRPEIVHDVPRYYIGILFVLGFAYLFWRASQSVWNAFVAAAFILLLLFLAALLLPALAAAKRKGMEPSSSPQTVSILNRKLVGIFETVTITSRDSRALENWLRDNRFAIAPDAKPVIDSYVKEGWVFVAAKIRRDDAKPDTSTPHPLSFTFKTDRPVYPMRLTGLNSQSLSVELYVFGPARAETPHLKIKRCTLPNYPQPPPSDSWSWNWWHRSPETPSIVHPLLRRWANGLPVATKLTGTLSPADMRRDVRLDWAAFQEKKDHLFSFSGAWTTALNWGVGIWAVSLLVACVLALSHETRGAKSAYSIGRVTLCCAALTGLIYFFLPKTEARLVKVHWGTTLNARIGFGWAVFDEVTNHSPVALARMKVENILKMTPTNTPLWNQWAEGVDWAHWRNDYLGGPMREEDSPGNYTIRETNGKLQLVLYDAEGAEHIQAIGE